MGALAYVAAATGIIALLKELQTLRSSWRRSTSALPAPTTADIDKAKDMLAGLVSAQWKAETALRSLGDPEPIPVPWRSTENKELMVHPRLIARGALTFPSLNDQISDLADDFRTLRCRRLVILGGPGTGKTTLAVQLLMELVKTRRPDEPVPVLLSAARWDTATHPRLQDWLEACLHMDYPALRADELAPDSPRTLAIRSELLPILDGMDELSDEARAGILAALNESMCESDQLILTCRTDQFAQSVNQVGDVLNAAAVIEPRPLSPDAAADYLQACLPAKHHDAWSFVLNALREGTAPSLAEVTSTPFGLWLVRSTYIAPKYDPSSLLDLGRRDPSELNDHLCDRLIPALLSSRPLADDQAEPFRPRHTWKPEQVRRWLTYLSHQLTRGEKEASEVAWWHLARLTSTHAVRLAVSLVFGLVIYLAIGILTQEFWAGAALGLLAFFIVLFVIGSWFTESPGYADFRLRGRLPLLVRSLKDALIAGVFGALFGGLSAVASVFARYGAVSVNRVVVFDAAKNGAITIGLLSGTGFLIILGLIRWIERPAPTAAARTPLSTWRADRTLTIVRTLGGLVLVLLLGGVIGWQSYSLIHTPTPKEGLLLGLLIALPPGLLLGLMLGSHHAWLAYSLAIPQLATMRRLPVRAMDFLDDAHRLGLLRTEGPFYQFRNIELQKHLLRDQYLRSLGQPPRDAPTR